MYLELDLVLEIALIACMFVLFTVYHVNAYGVKLQCSLHIIHVTWMQNPIVQININFIAYNVIWCKNTFGIKKM